MDSIQDWIRVHKFVIKEKEEDEGEHFWELEDEGVYFKIIHNTLLIKYLWEEGEEDDEDYCKTWVYQTFSINNIKEFIAFESPRK